MRSITTVVIGGQAGLAMSRCLTDRSIDHVVLERGEVANSWRTERWDSLRLLTPNWQSRLPGYRYEGDDPDGYRAMPEVIEYLSRYAEVISAPRLPRCEPTMRDMWWPPIKAAGVAAPWCWLPGPAIPLAFRHSPTPCRPASPR